MYEGIHCFLSPIFHMMFCDSPNYRVDFLEGRGTINLGNMIILKHNYNPHQFAYLHSLVIPLPRNLTWSWISLKVQGSPLCPHQEVLNCVFMTHKEAILLNRRFRRHFFVMWIFYVVIYCLLFFPSQKLLLSSQAGSSYKVAACKK